MKSFCEFFSEKITAELRQFLLEISDEEVDFYLDHWGKCPQCVARIVEAFPPDEGDDECDAVEAAVVRDRLINLLLPGIFKFVRRRG